MIRPGDFVIDPFVGSGSIAIAMRAIEPQALVFGSDIDKRVLHGYAVGKRNSNSDIPELPKYDIFSNFRHYNLALPEIVRCDIGQLEFRKRPFDAIVCDPPYGRRHRSKTETHKADSDFEVNKIYSMLLSFAGKYLKPRGRLVFLFPINPDCRELPEIPLSNAFELVSISH